MLCRFRYFTGKPWDLPCNCGLSDCQAVPNAGDPSTACCARSTEAGSQRCDRKIRMQTVPEVNTPEDSESLTSTAVTELDGPSSDPISFWQTCRLNRQLRGSDRTIEEVLWSCHRLATRFLLLRQNVEALGRWSRFAHVYLRRASSSPDSDDVFPATWPNPRLFRPFDAETGELEEIRSDEWRLGDNYSSISFAGLFDHFWKAISKVNFLICESYFDWLVQNLDVLWFW